MVRECVWCGVRGECGRRVGVVRGIVCGDECVWCEVRECVAKGREFVW